MRAHRQVQAWVCEHPGVSSVLLAGLAGLAAVLVRPGPGAQPVPQPSVAGWVTVALACLALVWRLRWPVAVWAAALGLAVAGTVVDDHVSRAVPAVALAIYTVAAHRPWRTAVAVALGSAAVLLVAAGAGSAAGMFDDGSYALLAFGGMVGAIGIAVRNQRAVVAAAEERARIAELTRDEEAQRRVVEERLRIARELHDVVAHHISVVNVQAGVARHLLRTDVEAADAALGNVREAAALVLRETGSILGLLRTTEDATGTAPAPGAAGLDALVADGRRAGLELEWTVSGTPRPLAPAADLAAYRVVQEALTNARRHGSGSARLLVDWTGREVLLEVSNPWSRNGIPATKTPGAKTPGAKSAGAKSAGGAGAGFAGAGGAGAGTAGADGGHGLLGMRERVAAAGGRLDAGPDAGGFTVRAVLPTTDEGLP